MPGDHLFFFCSSRRRHTRSLRDWRSDVCSSDLPLAAGVDALALGTATGAMVLVLRTGYSDREMALNKLQALTHLPIRVLGAVLNDVRGSRYKYYSYYLEGYEARDEQPASRLMRR